MKQLRFPGTFCVGSGILGGFPSYVSCYGKDIAFIGGKRSLGAVREALEKGFAGSGCSCSFVVCKHVATLSEIARITDMQEVSGADVLCGVGGGASMDIARAIANRQGKALVMLPTTVASDAPCSYVSVFYSEDGSEVAGDQLFHKCPDMVLVDAKVIAQAPARHLASGMGDALATYYEASTCHRNPNGTNIAETALMLGRLCREIVLRDGLAAYRSVQKGIVTPQLESVIEANCFLSGVGGANTGCAAAHGIGDYLCQVPGGHQFMHGERVFIGLVVQLVLEHYAEEEIRNLVSFGKKIGLPASIGDMGVEDVAKTAKSLAKGLQGDHFMANLCCDYSEDILAGAIAYAQALAEG